MIEVIGAGVGGPIRRGMTLFTTNEIAELVVLWARSFKAFTIRLLRIIRDEVFFYHPILYGSVAKHNFFEKFS